jgi:uncharacterized SAM-binding protein YcdF (DUF218 family)
VIQRLKTVFLLLGCLLALVTLMPPTWYGQWLARPWTDVHAPALIVLGGDSVRDGTMGLSSYWRSVYAVDVWHEGGVKRIVLTGDAQTVASMRDWIVGQGVPAASVTVEDHSLSTRENALFTARLLRDIPGPYLLLTSDIHTWRAYRVFRKAGIDVLPRPAPDAFKRGNDWRDRWRVFLDIAVECGKIAYYKAKNWI